MIVIDRCADGADRQGRAPATKPNTAPAADAGQVRRLINQLGDDNFARRESAGEQLAALGEAALAALREARSTRSTKR